MKRTDTRDVAALLAATDDNGQFDPVKYEAERLILHNRHAGTMDSDALMRAVHHSPLYHTGERDQLIRTISDNLNTSDEQSHFGKAMGSHYRWSEITHGLAEAWRWAEGKIEAVDQRITGTLAAGQNKAQATLDDPNASWSKRLEAEVASVAIGRVQREYGQVEGIVSDAVGTVTGVVDAAKLGYRFSTDHAFRESVLQVVKNYVEEIEKDPAKAATDAYRAAKGAYDTWHAGYGQAKAEGRGQEYVGRAQGVAALEVITSLIPASKVGKLGEALELLDHSPIRSVSEAAGLLQKVASLEREGGAAAKAAQEVTRSALVSAREEGKLAEFIEAAKKTETVNGMLRAGVFTPDDLKEIAKGDVNVFKSADGTAKHGVTFQEAIDASMKSVDLKKLSHGQLDDIGEAIHTYDMAQKGYTDIVSVKNKSGHGVDFIARNPDGQLEIHEMKTSSLRQIAEQKGSPDVFATTRLERAVSAADQWADKNTTQPGVGKVADALLKQIGEDGEKIDTRRVQINIHRTPDHPGLTVDKPGPEPWATSKPGKHAEVQATPQSPAVADVKPFVMPKDMRDPAHPGHETYRSTLAEVRSMEAARGIPPGPHSERLAAGLVVAVEYANAVIDRVELRGNQAVALARPSGEPNKSVALGTDFAMSRSVEEHSIEWAKARSPHYANAPAAERSPEQVRLLNELSPRDQAICAKLRENLPPQFGDDMVVHAALEARRAGINSPEQLGAVAIRGDHLFMQGVQAGVGQSVNLSQPAPPMQQTVNEAHALDQQQVAQQQVSQNGLRGPATA